MTWTRSLAAALSAAAVLSFAATAGASGAPAYVEDEVIVKYRDGVTTAQRLALFGRSGVVRTLGEVAGVGAKVVRVSGDAAAVSARLERSQLVEYAEPNYIGHTLGIPNDPRFGEQWGLHNTGQTGGTPDADIDAPEGWDRTPGTVRIGIVDTGIDQSHPDLAGKTAACGESIGLQPTFGQVREGSCNDAHGHGTHVAGIVSANARNGVGVAGVAYNSPLVICRAAGADGRFTAADVANCIHWAHARGAKVISMSFAFTVPATSLLLAVQAAWEGGGPGGSLLVAGAGNDGNASVVFPAGFAEVVSVGATDRRDQKWSFSNANPDVEVSAPGVDVLSTSRGGGYALGTGTSMATPHAAGVAAMIWAQNPNTGAAGARILLDAAVNDLGAAGPDPSFGFGRVNLCKAAWTERTGC